MVKRYYGGLISAASPTVSSSSASGIFNTTQHMQAKRIGSWPSPAAPPVVYVIYSWGNGGSGQLGLTNTNTYYAPQQVGSLNWSVVSAGYSNSQAIKTDGTLWAWGSNLYGQIGDGTTTRRLVGPVRASFSTQPSMPKPSVNTRSARSTSRAISGVGSSW